MIFEPSFWNLIARVIKIHELKYFIIALCALFFPCEFHKMTETKCQVIKLIDDVDGSCAYLYKNWLGKDYADTLLKFCQDLDTKLYPFGMKQKRLLWACGDPGVYHAFRNVEVDIHHWPAEFKNVHNKLFKEFDVYTNFLLVNHYRNGQDGTGLHADGELNAKNKSVFTASLGATRKMRLSFIHNTGKKDIVFEVEHGDLFYMFGDIQSKVKHAIDEDASVKDTRYSLTSRSTLLREITAVERRQTRQGKLSFQKST